MGETIKETLYLAMPATRLVRIKDAAEQLGYERSYAYALIPTLFPVYRTKAVENGPLVIKQSDLDAYLAQVLSEPVRLPAATGV